jgi:pyrimidine deaminase RibD-like protein
MVLCGLETYWCPRTLLLKGVAERNSFTSESQVRGRGSPRQPGAAHRTPLVRPHAEAMALSRVSGALHEVMAFVTLEPCSFDGRTPSWAVALIARHIDRVVVALLDPHPRNQGRGIQLLEHAGIPVTLGVWRAEAEADWSAYLWKDVTEQS